jgi:hypothetical protein
MIKGYLFTCSELFNKYTVYGPVDGDEALEITRRLDPVQYKESVYLVILLCDAKTKNQHKPEYEKFLKCAETSKLRCKKEAQVVTLEYLVGSHLSMYMNPDQFVPPTNIELVETVYPVKKEDEIL